MRGGNRSGLSSGLSLPFTAGKGFMKKRIVSLLLTLLTILSLLPTAAFAAGGASSITLERFGYSGVTYESASLGRCQLHQMYYDCGGKTTVGFCGTKGGHMGSGLEGQTWGNPTPITDPTVRMMMAYYYPHSTGTFTDAAVAAAVRSTLLNPAQRRAISFTPMAASSRIVSASATSFTKMHTASAPRANTTLLAFRWLRW